MKFILIIYYCIKFKLIKFYTINFSIDLLLYPILSNFTKFSSVNDSKSEVKCLNERYWDRKQRIFYDLCDFGQQISSDSPDFELANNQQINKVLFFLLLYNH